MPNGKILALCFLVHLLKASQIDASEELINRIQNDLPNLLLEGDRRAKEALKKEKENTRVCNISYPYRLIDGSCNNLNTGLGASGLPFKRMLRPAYEDRVNQIRGEGRTKNILPNPRMLSVALSGALTPSPSDKLTQMLKLWGQFLDHDITNTPESKAASDSNGDGEPDDIPCCDKGTSTSDTTEDCAPIDVSQDIFYTNYNISCLRFVRSLPAATNSLGAREQINQITSFIDASNVYGSKDKKAKELRKLRGGRMKENEAGELLTCKRSARCLRFLPESQPAEKFNFFTAGDVRVNEQPSLTSMHHLLLRIHNLIAEKFKMIDSQLTDEIIYQETRKIVGALMEKITYKEFLPIVLGKTAMKNYSLRIPTIKFGGYDPSINPSIGNVVGGAAFRFGHTLVTDHIRGDVTVPLVETFFNNEFLKEESALYPSKVLKGECELPSEKVDVKLVETLTNKLFADGPNYLHGSDLMALNIMRGRDHGLPEYNAWREFCGLKAFNSFEEMKTEMSVPEVVNVFSRLYSNVSDIDLFPAALAEYPLDGLLGPTFVCILGKQFHDLKFGDRFWFENPDQPERFTKGMGIKCTVHESYE